MLPQVATENGWTVEEFLGYTSRDKAGIGWDGWKDAEISIYEGVVLEDNQKVTMYHVISTGFTAILLYLISYFFYRIGYYLTSTSQKILELCSCFCLSS